MPHRRWHRVEDPWDTLPSPDHLDQRASALQIGEHVRRVMAETGLVLSPGAVLDLAVRRGLGTIEQETVLRHLSGRLSAPFVLPEVPFWVPGDFREGLPKCPRPRLRWMISQSSGDDFVQEQPCNGWTCEVCAEANAWTKLAEANFRFESVDGLWVATAPTDATTTDRIRQRRHDNQPVRDLAVRRRDHVKHLYASVDLTGDAPPQDGIWMDIDDALRHLQDVAMAPPTAVGRVLWSTSGWPDLPAEIPRRPRPVVDLGDGSDGDLRDLVREEVHQRAVTEFGLDPNDEDWRKKVPGPWIADAFVASADGHRSTGWG